MNKKDLSSILAAHRFLKDMPKAHLDLLTGCAANIRVEPEDYLFKAGQGADRFYLIRQGRVRIELPSGGKRAVVIQTVSEGELLGWSWLIPPYEWHLSAKAEDAVLAIAFDGNCLRNKMQTDHDLGYEVYRRFSEIMSERLEQAFLQIVGISG
ncbi:MAG: hypothetical protein A2X36_07975 [Elusimicrobia bacterium GWA2_69_24]|nr:MAG: hypothetical protein A2X36_07975 [Elusimicrobia bacterium GWA2_69_24]